MYHLYIFIKNLSYILKLNWEFFFINTRLTNYQKALELDVNKY